VGLVCCLLIVCQTLPERRGESVSSARRAPVTGICSNGDIASSIACSSGRARPAAFSAANAASPSRERAQTRYRSYSVRGTNGVRVPLPSRNAPAVPSNRATRTGSFSAVATPASASGVAAIPTVSVSSICSSACLSSVAARPQLPCRSATYPRRRSARLMSLAFPTCWHRESDSS
jgi:hypothetical protein